MKIIQNRLYKDDDTPYPYKESPNRGGQMTPEYLVMHYTAGRSALSSINWLTNPTAKASAHLVIGRDGSITQLVPFDTIAWHAGRSSWNGRHGLNQYSLGIELDNAGMLTRHGNKFRAWFGQEFEEHDVIEAVHKHGGSLSGWHLYTAEQLETALEVAAFLIHHYRLKDIVGHDDIAPRRKQDPGPAFPIEKFKMRLFGRQEEEPISDEHF